MTVPRGGAVRRAALLLLAASALGLAAACGDDEPAGPGGARGAGEGRIGAQGGTVETDDGNARLVVPAGALDAPTRIQIGRLLPDSLPAVLAARQRVSNAYRFGPEGLVFRTPVEVQLFFDADLLPPDVRPGNLTLGRVNAAGQLEDLANIRVLEPPFTGRVALQFTRRGIGGQVSSFSPFAVWVGDGVLEVVASTSGESLDPDGYTVSVDGGPSQPLAVNGTATFAGLAHGDHVVELAGVAAGCSVMAENPRTVRVAGRETARTEFAVVCAA